VVEVPVAAVAVAVAVAHNQPVAEVLLKVHYHSQVPVEKVFPV
jgi:hypothetical protein